MYALYVPALLVAFLISLLEFTEVVALVFALGTDASSLRPVALGAIGGAATVGLIGIGFATVLVAFPSHYLLWAAAVVLAAFGVYLFRSTLRTYRYARGNAHSGTPPPSRHDAVQFGGGFSVGAVETTEAVIVLLALAAAGYGFSALIGAAAGASVLVVAAAIVGPQIRRIKVPWLKLGGTSLLFTFAIFWAGEAVGVAWPGGDLFLIPMVVAVAAVVRGGVALGVRPPPSGSGA